MASTTANIGQTGGESNHIQTEAELAAHTHANTAPSGNYYDSGSGSGGTAGVNLGYGAKAVTTSTGSSIAMNVLDPYIALNYIIKY